MWKSSNGCVVIPEKYEQRELNYQQNFLQNCEVT